MRLEHHLVGGYMRYISPHNIIIIIKLWNTFCQITPIDVPMYLYARINPINTIG